MVQTVQIHDGEILLAGITVFIHPFDIIPAFAELLEQLLGGAADEGCGVARCVFFIRIGKILDFFFYSGIVFEEILLRDVECHGGACHHRAVPDRAELHFGIRTQADTAEEAQQTNSKNVDAVVKVLKKNGIKEEKIQTSMYDVSPQYDWNTGDGSKVIGYSAFSNLSVKDVVIEEAGKLITACTNAGANEFNGISYSCTQYNTLYAEALKKAVAAAQTKAGVLAEAAGRKLGEVKMISEGYQDMTYANNSEKVYAAAGMGAAEDSASAASILPGQAEITANVTVTYILQ